MAEKVSGIVNLQPVDDLVASPTFPWRKSPAAHGPEGSQVSSPVLPESPQIPPSFSHSPDLTGSASNARGDGSVKPSKPSKHRLQFKGDILTLVGRKRNASSGSTDDGQSPVSPGGQRSPTTPKSPSSKFPRVPRSPGRTIKTAKGHYSVAEKDMSVLERVSHRAHKRAQRVRKPHEVFVELEELHWDSSEELEWEETARWIKFEEDVEEGSGRWGRPHISALAFHSLADLRRGLEQGCIMLDVEGEDFPTIAKKIVNNLVWSGQLPSDCVEPVLRVLRKKHKHQHQVTLWEKLKNSATGPDGTLHHLGELGEDLIHRITSTVHSSLNEMNEAEGEPRNHSNSKPDSHSHSHAHSHHRLSLSPLLDGGVDVLQECSIVPSGEMVMFNISDSSDSLPTPESSKTGSNGTPSSSATDNNVTESTHLGEISTDVEFGFPDGTHRRDPRSKNPESERAVSERDQNPEPLHRNKSMLSLMEKIPEEAESLTVLVGGVKFLEEPIVAFVRLAQSHLLGDLTEVPVPVRFIYLLLGPELEGGAQDYHEVGRAMATLMSDTRFHEVAYSAVTDYDLMDAIDEFLDDSLVLPPGDWDQNLLLPIMHERNELRRRKELRQEVEARQLFAVDPLKHSCRPCGGIWSDLKKLRKRYVSDFRDALHFQVFISIVFLFISFIAPAIAFGGLMEDVTDRRIGVTETLVATGLCGIVYGLFAVQPLSILAFTGPLLLFEKIVFEAAQSFKIDYLEWRACISLLLMVILIIFAISESTYLVTYFTLFSKEIFTGVVALFFIIEASRTIYRVFQRNPLCGINYPCGDYSMMTNTCQNLTDTFQPVDNLTNVTDFMEDGNLTGPSLPRGFRICNQPNTALWSTILCLGTFFIAVLMRKFRQGKFLGKKGRRLLSDFSIFTALTIMVIVAYLLRNLITVETLQVSPGFTPSNPTTRGWFINPFSGKISLGQGFGALVPASLVGVLIFFENQLTVVAVNKPIHKLEKEVGYHFDLLIVGVLAGVCGLLGMPWLCAASVRSIQHLQALSVYSRKNAPGEKPKLLYVYEQRITNIAIHLLILLSPFAYPVLQVIPISVVLGIFFFLGYTSIIGVELATRIKLLFTPTKHHPDVNYVRKARPLKMHLYTIIQVVSVALLWALRLSPAAMIYPVTIVFLIPFRKLLGRFAFTQVEIEALDNEDLLEDYIAGEGDEYEETHVPY